MSPEDRRSLEDLFDRAAELPQAEHAAFIERECGSNERLRDELERLLAGLSGEDIVTRSQPVGPTRLGKKIGPYTLQERIGEGGMGEVYAAEQTEPVVRRVALKLIKPGMDSAQVVTRFEAERQALARMTHPHVAQVFDGGTTDDGRPYFVMELVVGEPITGYCDGHALPTAARLELFLDVCKGVQHAHQKGLIHRDLKPSNLLVMQQDGHALPKIIDFGVARATTGTLAERTLHTLVGQVVGTLDYMSPEQADPRGVDIDTRSDVYSLGVVLYQLVSGLMPFDHQAAQGKPLSEIQREIRELDPPTPSTRLRRQTGTATVIAKQHGVDERALVRQLSGDLDWICLKALEKDPDRRYASVAELEEDVRRHLAHEPVLAARPGGMYRARKFVRRHVVGVAAGTLVAAATIAGVVGTVSARIEAENALIDLTTASAPGIFELLKQEADELWPPTVDKLTAYNAWMADARALVANLDPAADGSYPGFRRQLAVLRKRALPGPDLERDGDQQSFRFADVEDRRAHQQLAPLIEGLEELSDPETGLIDGTGISAEHGWSIRRRREYASFLEERTLTGAEAKELWADAIASIADNSAYDGLVLTPQLGLLPIGPDPESQLWEFAHVMSGEPAQRTPAGGIDLATPGMGLVLVLIPGGEFVMGAQNTDPEQPNYDPLLDSSDEGPPHRVTLEPFFLSKYEMTQEQWREFTGTLHPELAPRYSPRGPVVGVSWPDATRTARRLGLVLPTEEQWEYAARGGTQTVWWTGNEVSTLEGAENLFDKSLDEAWPRARIASGEDPVDWSDGQASTADVGSFPANPFGLHDVLGNVSEWTSSLLYKYAKGPDHPDPKASEARTARGGNNRSGEYSSRPSHRGFNDDKDVANPVTGLRPARALDAP